MKLCKVLEHQHVTWCDQIISGLHFFPCNNWIYPPFHAVPFEAVPLQTDAVSSAIVPSLEAFSDDLFVLCKCPLWLFLDHDDVTKSSPLRWQLEFSTCDYLQKEMWVSLNSSWRSWHTTTCILHSISRWGMNFAAIHYKFRSYVKRLSHDLMRFLSH